MHTRRHLRSITSILALFIAVSVGSVQGWADKSTARLRVTVRPVESEIFIDGLHMGDASYDGRLTVPDIGPGEHTVGVYCYGWVPQTFKLNFTAGQTTTLEVRLEPISGTVPGPFGRIQIKGAPRAAILMNGKTAEYVVGHADETDNSTIWQQELLVPPGTHQLTLVHGEKTIWSGPVTVEADLIRALREGWIAGAALDVFDHEPLSADSPLWDMENVILTPHISGGTEIYNQRAVAIFADNLRRYLAGEPLQNVVDPSRGY